MRSMRASFAIVGGVAVTLAGAFALFGGVPACAARSAAPRPAHAPATVATPPSEQPYPTRAAVDAAVPAPDAMSARAPLPPEPPTPAAEPPPPASVSIGAADDGALRHGVPLPDVGPGFRFNPRRPQDARYGTQELVSAIMTAAAGLPPGQPLVVNDLGLPEGGPIPQHGSHQAGRDVDILFFYRDAAGKPHPSIGVPVEPDLTGYDYQALPDPSDDIELRLDVQRTWQFMAAFVRAAGDDLQRIFIVEHVRSALLAEAERQHASQAIRDRFALVTCQPGTPHDDHLHARFYCTPDDMAEGCLDKPPTYPFRREALASLGLEPALYRGRPDRAARAKRTTTPKQARKRAGRMHRDVIAFLERRKGWLKRKGPPRPFCR